MAWMPGASRVQIFSGNRHRQPLTKIVLHTTEGSSWPGYGGGGSAPHFTVRRGRATKSNIRQHIDTAYSAKALVNRRGGVQTNNAGAIQIEFIGSCDRSYARKHGLFFTEDADDDDLEALAAVLAWIHEEHGVPLVIDGNLDWPTTNAAYATAPQRLSYAQWNEYRGMLGHTHVPENDHWDPGAFPVARLLRLARAGSSSSGNARKPWRTSPRVNGFTTAEVRDIQRTLVEEGYPVGSYGIDGSYGDDTGTAVQQLQTDLGITADGIYGPTTEAEMASIKDIVTQNQAEIREARAHAKRAADVATVNQRRIGRIPGDVLDEPITLAGMHEGRTSSLRTKMAWQGHNFTKTHRDIAATQSAVVTAVQKAGQEQGLTDEAVQAIARAAVEAAAQVSAEDVAGQLEVTVSKGD